MDLTEDMRQYVDRLERTQFARPPRDTLDWAAGGELFSPEVHLAFNATPYVLIGKRIQEMQPRPGQLLDMGCGTGYATAYLKQHAAQVTAITAIDHIPELAAYAKANYSRPGLTFMAADSCALPFSSESFDMVTAVLSILHNMTQPQAHDCLTGVGRVLKRGGILIAATPNRARFQDLYHENPNDNPKLMFSPLSRHEYYRDELAEFIRALAGPDGRLFETVSIDSLTNAAFQPVLAKTILAIKRKRFLNSGRDTGLSALVRRILPGSLRARYFFRLIHKTCQGHGVSLQDIAQSAQHHPEGEEVQADQLVVIARKAA